MKHNPGRKMNISTFDLKQQFISILASELKNCGFDIVLGFESSFQSRICTLKFVDGKRVNVRVNLGYVKKSVYIDGGSQMFNVLYCALFIVEYIKQIEHAKNSVPQSYFEGLAFLNAIEVFKLKKIVSVYSPLFHWDKKPKRSYCLRPLEISSAINSLNRIRLVASRKLNQQEKSAVNTFCDSLLLYAGLPEVSYSHARTPVYALVDSFRKLADLIALDPILVQEYPILTLAPFENIKQLTVDELFLYCIQSDNEFLMGVSIRLIVFFHLSKNIEVTDDVHKKLVGEMKQYIEYSITYCNELSKPGRYLLSDNLFAVKAAVKSINDYLTIHETGVITGNIHSIV